MLLWACAMQGQLGRNCPGEHPDLLRDNSGRVRWFTPERLAQMAVKRVMPKTADVPIGVHYDSYVTVKILVDQQGDIGCLWGNAGNPIFFPAADEAARWWKFKPMIVNGKAREFVGTLRFHFHT